jgi:hypothetical protein
MAVLMKAIKRTMAAEYSRELSVKVFARQCRLTELGFLEWCDRGESAVWGKLETEIPSGL